MYWANKNQKKLFNKGEKMIAVNASNLAAGKWFYISQYDLEIGEVWTPCKILSVTSQGNCRALLGPSHCVAGIKEFHKCKFTLDKIRARKVNLHKIDPKELKKYIDDQIKRIKDQKQWAEFCLRQLVD